MGYPANYPTIKQGLRLIVELSGRPSLQLTAVVDRVDADGKMQLGCLDPNAALQLRPNLAVMLEYFREGVVYRMECSVIDLGPDPSPGAVKPKRQITVSAPREVKKIQRRRFPRATVSVEVAYIEVDVPQDFDVSTRLGKKLWARWARDLEDSGRKAYTETLSGSGLRMRALVPLAQGKTLFVCVELPSQSVQLLGEVVWLGTKPPQEVPGEAVGVDFKNTNEADRQALLEFVAGQQRHY